MTTKQRKPRRWVKMFKPRFAPMVRDNLKLQTMRPWPKRGLVDVPRPGDTLDARQWEGRAYNSPQVKIGERKITAVDEVQLVVVGGRLRVATCPLNGSMWKPLPDEHYEDFARADGFADWADMQAWFLAEYKKLPPGGLRLYRVRWEPVILPPVLSKFQSTDGFSLSFNPLTHPLAVMEKVNRMLEEIRCSLPDVCLAEAELSNLRMAPGVRQAPLAGDEVARMPARTSWRDRARKVWAWLEREIPIAW